MTQPITKLAALAPLLLFGSAVASNATFTPLGQLPGSEFSQATSISNDGQFVGGHSDLAGALVPIIWNDGLMSELTVPAGFNSGAYINEISGDGQTAVAIAPGPDGFRGIRWDADGVPHILQTMPGMFSSFNAINLDGSVTGGFTNQDFFTGSSDAVIWTSRDGEEILGDIPGPNHEGSITAISDDGTIFAGYGTDTVRRPVVWTEREGFRVLDGPDHEPAEGMAVEISANGQIIVGHIFVDNTEVPAFWVNENAAHVIDLWPGYEVGAAVDAVDDGSLVVGNWRLTPFSDELGSLAFLWDETNGVRPLQDALAEDFGLDLGGWTLNQVSAISPDGTALAGTGMNPQGELEAYRILLPVRPGVIGDLDGNGVVDVFDLLILLDAWGACGDPADCPADLTGDGTVDVFDLLVLLDNWG